MITAACSSPKPSHSKTLSVTQDQSASTSTSTTAATSTTIPAPSVDANGACTSVSAVVGQTQGAAGTITGTVTLTPLADGRTCTMDGYPTMALRDTAGAAVPVTIVDGLTVSVSGSANAPPARVTLAPGTRAQFAYQYSDVPSGSETTCPRSSTATVTPPGTGTASAPIGLSIAPCGNGTIRVSPVYPTG
jgi:hypothetical protein